MNEGNERIVDKDAPVRMPKRRKGETPREYKQRCLGVEASVKIDRAESRIAKPKFGDASPKVQSTPDLRKRRKLLRIAMKEREMTTPEEDLW